MTQSIITTTLKKEISLTSENSSDIFRKFDMEFYGSSWIDIPKGDSLQVWIKKYEDGRTYYTYFKKIDNVYFTYTYMRKGDQGHPNCGMFHRFELEKALNYIK